MSAPPGAWRGLVRAVDEAIEMKAPDEGIYGKRDWALVAVLEELKHIALAELAKPTGPIDGEWMCTECAQVASIQPGAGMDGPTSRWRWAGDHWQHHHDHPVGHVAALYLGPLPE